MPIGYPRHASRGFDCIPYWRRKVRAMPNQEKDWHCFFYLGPADGIDGGIAVYTLAPRRLRQEDRTWRLLQDIPQFLMRYDDHSKLFNGEDPKFSALVSDDQSPTGDQMGNDAIEIYMHFAVRPDPDYHASHTGDASVYLTAPGQEIDLELVSEGVDPVRLNPPPDGESSTRLSYDPPDNEALSVSFFAAASSSEGEKSVVRVRRNHTDVRKHPSATILTSAFFVPTHLYRSWEFDWRDMRVTLMRLDICMSTISHKHVQCGARKFSVMTRWLIEHSIS